MAQLSEPRLFIPGHHSFATSSSLPSVFGVSLFLVNSSWTILKQVWGPKGKTIIARQAALAKARRWKQSCLCGGREMKRPPEFNAGMVAAGTVGECCQTRTSCDPACASMYPRHCCTNNPPTGLLAESCPDKLVQAWHLEPWLGPRSVVFTPLALHVLLWPGLPLRGSSGNIYRSQRTLPPGGAPGCWDMPRCH